LKNKDKRTKKNKKKRKAAPNKLKDRIKNNPTANNNQSESEFLGVDEEPDFEISETHVNSEIGTETQINLEVRVNEQILRENGVEILVDETNLSNEALQVNSELILSAFSVSSHLNSFEKMILQLRELKVSANVLDTIMEGTRNFLSENQISQEVQQKIPASTKAFLQKLEEKTGKIRNERIVYKENKEFVLFEIKSWLEYLFASSVFQSFLQISHTPTTDLNSFAQGSWFRKFAENCAKISAVPLALTLYFDGFQKSSTKSIKGIYMGILNTEPEFFLPTNHKFVLSLVPNADGCLTKVVKKILEQLKKIECTELINPAGERKKVAVALACVIGDAPGLAEFLQLLNFHSGCRVCMTASNEYCVTFEGFTMKSREEGLSYLIANKKGDYGYTGDLWAKNNLGFDVHQQTPADELHTEFLGLIKEEYGFFCSSLDQTSKDNFEEISESFISSSLKHSSLFVGREWRALTQFLPLIFFVFCQKYKPNKDFRERMQNFLLHIEYLRDLFSYSNSPLSLILLKGKIRQHHKKYVELYVPQSQRKNHKHNLHVSLHWPEWIEKFGPVQGFSCQTFEAKHRILKEIKNKQTNQKNSEHDVALNAAQEDLNSFLFETIREKKNELKNPQKSLVLDEFYSFHQINQAKTFNSIVIKGKKYSVSNTVAFLPKFSPTYGEIIKIFQTPNNSVFIEVIELKVQLSSFFADFLHYESRQVRKLFSPFAVEKKVKVFETEQIIDKRFHFD
jgi:hypothetical protein